MFIARLPSFLGCLILIALAAPVQGGTSAISGFGSDTPGGRGGQVIKVTTLAASGAGSLRAALETKGPRIIVFEVGGNIDLDKAELEVREPFVTIAGQTAPSPGISLIRGGLKIRSHDVVMQHVRIRIGDAGLARKSDYERDVSIEGKNAWNVLIDHCSVSWGTDENLSVSGPRYDGPAGTARRVTLSNNIIAEGLVNATHIKGKHSMGSLVHDNVTEVAIIGNLYAHNHDRNPWYKGGASGVIVNNYIYNPGAWAIRLGYNPKEWVGHEPAPPAPKVSIVGNVLQNGVNTPTGLGLVGSNAPMLQGDAFMADNQAFDLAGQAALQSFGGVTQLEARPLWPIGLRAWPASQTREAVLAGAGARPADRDSVDQRLIADIRAGKGRHIDSQEEVGGYPAAKPSQRSLQVPARDIEAWLEVFSAKVEGR